MTRELHVLHVLNGAGGGAALSTLALARALEAHGVVSAAVCHEAGSREQRGMVVDAFSGRVRFAPLYLWNKKLRARTWKRPLIELHQLWRTGATRRSTRAVEAAARAHTAALIHSNSVVLLDGALAARRCRLPHLWHVREALGAGNPFRLPLEGRAFGWASERLAERLVANSEICAQALRGWVRPECLEIVPNGIDVDHFAVREHTDISQRPLHVGMVGNLSARWKKHELFLRAAALVRPELALRFTIYGDVAPAAAQQSKAYPERLRGLARELGLSERLDFAGFVADPAEIMSELDVVVHPADGESFGRVAVEALASGLPVVGVNRGGVAEIVEHEVSGLLVPPDDAHLLAHAIERLAADRALRQRMGEAGRRRARQRYSLESYADAMAHLYRRLLEPHTARGGSR